MVQIAKSLVFLCMLIGWSQAFPYHDVTTEDKAMKDVDKVTDLTPPVCRVVNESLDCPLSCQNASWEVTYIMSDGAGSGIDRPSLSATDSSEFNTTFLIYIDTTVDENGYNATIVKYIGSCCFKDVEISVTDKAGNKAKCPFNIRRPVTTISPMTVKPTSSSSTATISLWSSLILMALKSLLF
ncbi:hypothetical protein R3I93_015333 [Phoxinus phoxinus]|uniref:Uncharacterized protein n=1 Tax=Phoxinus phoxinus TaxID=58324 RepID=A0AAN9H007_9TELE